MSARLCLLQRPRLQLTPTLEVSLGSKDAILLAVLALDGPTPRERLAAWLWPDAAPGQARTNLRQRLFRLRKLAGSEIVSTGTVLCLSSRVSLDITEAEQALLDDPYAAEGELLGVFEYLDCHDLDQWLRRARANWRARVQEALMVRVEQLEATGRLDLALVYARRLARDEPLHEHAQRTLMKILHRQGDRSAALQVYERLRQTLSTELGVSPSWQSEALRAELEAAPSPGEPASGSGEDGIGTASRGHFSSFDASFDEAYAHQKAAGAHLSDDSVGQWQRRIAALGQLNRVALPARVRLRIERLLREVQSLADASTADNDTQSKSIKRRTSSDP